MRGLSVSLFGGVRVSHGGVQAATHVTRSVQGLLAYLVLRRHRCHAREALLGVFWGDQSEQSARGCLNTALWRVRRILEPRGLRRGTYLIQTAGEIGFNTNSKYCLDVEVLEDDARRMLPQSAQDARDEDVRRLESTVGLYAGDVLEGFYSDWALRERERLRLIYLDCLTWIMLHHASHESHQRAIEWGHLILAHDPLREEVHRNLMRLHLRAGQRASALLQYETCRKVLATELDAEPSEETRRLYAELRPTAGVARSRHASAFATAPLVTMLRDVVEGLDRLRGQLQHTIQLLDRLTGGERSLASSLDAPVPACAAGEAPVRRQ